MARGGARDEAALDEALVVLAGTAMDYPPLGFANHGPMAAEALVELGRPDDAVRWAVQYRDRLVDAPSTTAPVPAKRWREHLGDRDAAAWTARMSADVDALGWRDAVRMWVPRLLPGLAADALHGLIRTAHAVRGLEQAEVDVRREELVQGLAQWAARYQRLAFEPRVDGSMRPADALGGIPLTSRGREQPSIVMALARLGEVADIAGAVDAVGVGNDPAAFLEDLVATFVAVARRESTDVLSAIVFVHAVTGPTAARRLLGYVDPPDAAVAARYAWQACAGLYCAYAVGAEEAGTVVGSGGGDVVDRAVDANDEHAIKFCEAALASGAEHAESASARVSGWLREVR